MTRGLSLCMHVFHTWMRGVDARSLTVMAQNVQCYPGGIWASQTRRQQANCCDPKNVIRGNIIYTL